jgi:hypothetical protein
MFAQKNSKKLAFLTQNKTKLCKNLIIYIGLKKTPILLLKIAENRRKMGS